MSETDGFAVPHIPAGRKRKRRSSILKTVKPFDELQNIHSGGDKLHQKERRVSFANTIKIKEFLRELPAQFKLSDCPPNQTDGNQVRTEQLPLAKDHVIQVSTPKGQKKRCRVSVAGADRLSIIPKFDKSFTMTDEDDEDFEVWSDLSPSTAAPQEDTTLADKSSVHESLTFNLAEGAPLPPAELLGANTSAIPREFSDMDMSLNESAGTAAPILLSASALLPKTLALSKSTAPVAIAPQLEGTEECANSDMDISLSNACLNPEFPSNHNSVDMSFTVVQPMLEAPESPPKKDQHAPTASNPPCSELPDADLAANHNVISTSFTTMQPEVSFPPSKGSPVVTTELPKSTDEHSQPETLSNHNSVSMSFTMVQPSSELLPPPAKCDEPAALPTSKQEAEGRPVASAPSGGVCEQTHSSQPVPKSDVQAAHVALPEHSSKVPVKLGLPSQKPSSLRLVMASPVVRLPQSSFTAHHGSLFQTPLGPVAKLYGQLQGKGNPRISASKHLATPLASDKSSTALPKVPNTSHTPILPTMSPTTEKNTVILPLQSPPASHAPPLTAAAVMEDNPGWLQNAQDNTFALVDTSLDSNKSATEYLDPKKYATPSAHSNIPWPPSVQPNGNYESDLRKIISNLKVSSHDETIVVETPETVVVRSDAVPAYPVTNHTTLDNTTLMNSSALLQKSLMLSPAAFNRFLEALQCDKSVCADSFFVSADTRSEEEALNPGSQEIAMQGCDPDTQAIATKEEEGERATARLDETFTLPAREGSNETRLLECKANEDVDFMQTAHEVQTTVLSDDPEDAFRAPVTFGSYLKELQNRLTVTHRDLDHMLAADDKIEAAQKCVQLLHSAVSKAVLGVALLVGYGDLSGLSATHNWDTSDLPALSALPCLPQLLPDSSKLNWLQDVHEVLQEVYEVLAVVLGEAARVYPWLLEEVGDVGLVISLEGGSRLTLALAGPATAASRGEGLLPATRAVSSLHSDPPAAVTTPHCSSTLHLPEVLWKLTQST